MKRVIYPICIFLFYSSVPLSLFSQVQKGTDLLGELSNDNFGTCVSMPNANTIAVSAPYKHITTGNGANYGGQVTVYSWDGSSWQQMGYTIDGNTDEQYLGQSLCMPDAGTIAVGSPRILSNLGGVQILTPTGANWIPKGMGIFGEATGDNFGHSLSMPDANTIAIGAPTNDGNGTDAGNVRVFSWNSSAWTQKGVDIDGEAIGDYFGYSVSMPDANTVAIGANVNDGNGTDAGHVRIFSWNGSAWIQKGSDINGEAAGDNFGYSVSMSDENTITIGAPYNDQSASNSGSTSVYTWNGTTWVQKGLSINGEALDDYSGNSVSMPDVNTIAVGAYRNDGNGNQSGHVRVYRWDGTQWLQDGNDIDGQATGDNAGNSVCMPDANTLAIGALYFDRIVGQDIESNAGNARVFTFQQAGITDLKKQELQVQPNPANNFALITTSKPTTAFITSTNGSILSSLDLNGETTIDVSTFAPGIYFIRTSEGETVKFIKE